MRRERPCGEGLRDQRRPRTERRRRPATRRAMSFASTGPMTSPWRGFSATSTASAYSVSASARSVTTSARTHCADQAVANPGGKRVAAEYDDAAAIDRDSRVSKQLYRHQAEVGEHVHVRVRFVRARDANAAKPARLDVHVSVPQLPRFVHERDDRAGLHALNRCAIDRSNVTAVRHNVSAPMRSASSASRPRRGPRRRPVARASSSGRRRRPRSRARWRG